MKLFRGIAELLTLSGVAQKGGRHIKESDLGLLPKAAFLVDQGRILWIGQQAKIPRKLAKVKKLQEINLHAATVLPGFVECHTHAVFAGNRAAEFEMRNQGKSYQEIAVAGGGILSTMRATRKIPAAELKAMTQSRTDEFVRQGVTTLEMKSGYALNLKDELKMLEVAGQIKGPRVITTFLGPHAKPPEFATAEEYLQFLGDQVLPVVKKKKLSRRVDIFIEKGFFESDAAKEYLLKARKLDFDLVIHADQLSLSGGTDLGVSLGAVSVEHVIKIQGEQIQALAKSDCVAVLLPSADLYMDCDYPRARSLLNAGALVALATDFNPGTSPSLDLNLVGLLARLKMKMSLPEVIAAYTWNAARALRCEQQVGSLELGKDADFISTNLNWSELFYQVGSASISQVYRGGRRIFAI